jgi:hypothetical protein
MLSALFLDNAAMGQADFVIISLPMGTAINKALDASPHKDQKESILPLGGLA